MRLSQLLMVWPKKRPNGYIWSGKHRMVLKVQPWHLKGMDRDIYRVSRAILKGLALAFEGHGQRHLSDNQGNFEGLALTSEEVDRDIYRMRFRRTVLKA
jgi:hypothetical protein